MKSRIWVACLIGLAASTASFAATATLKVGDYAPRLQVGKWVQGGPISDFEKGKAYIVEFWATWCGPCRQSIPHLNETYKKYKSKNLEVIGVDCFERDDNLVEPFVKKMGEQMTYPVALDNKAGGSRGKMAETWMEAAGRDGIPTAFLVDTNGVLVWIGHPMALAEKTIEAVLAGNYDLKQAADETAKEEKSQGEMRKLTLDLNHAMNEKDWDTATEKLKEIEGLLPEAQRTEVGMVRFQILLGKKEYPAAYKQAREYSDSHLDNVMAQNQIAWRITAQPGLEKRDLELAELTATRAREGAAKQDIPQMKAGVLDTLARVKFMRGKKEDAITLESQAVDLAEGDTKAMLQKTLDSYRKGELPQSN